MSNLCNLLQTRNALQTILDFILVRKEQFLSSTKTLVRVQRATSPLVVILGKRGARGVKTRFIEKNGFLPLAKVFQLFKSCFPQGIGNFPKKLFFKQCCKWIVTHSVVTSRIAVVTEITS